MLSYKDIEELSLNHWPPLQTVLFDGWVLRFANGYTKRANSVNPIHYSTHNINKKIEECEEVYTKQNLRTIYKITPFVQPQNLDDMLEDKGYSLIDYSSVRILDLHTLTEPFMTTVITYEDLQDEWINDFCRLNNVEESHKITMKKMLSNIVAEKCFISLYDDNQVIGCGLGVLEREYIGLYDIVIDPNYRNQGYGEQLILNLLQWGKQDGAKYSYLAVLMDNEPALHLYSKIGYKEIYKYWYRVKGM